MVLQYVPLALTALSAGASIFSKKKAKKKSTMDKNQKKLWNDYHQGINGQGPLAGLYSFDANKARENYMQNVGRPQYENYQENIVPEITGAFRQKGLGNSSYAAQALERGGRKTQSNITAGMNDYLFKQEESINNRKANAINNSFNTKTFDYERPQEQPWDAFLNGAGGAAGKYVFDQFSSYNTPSTKGVK